jgi:hypothetical protein
MVLCYGAHEDIIEQCWTLLFTLWLVGLLCLEDHPWYKLHILLQVELSDGTVTLDKGLTVDSCW